MWNSSHFAGTNIRIGSEKMYDPRRHHRRSIRLKGYDYAQEGEYYVTLCVQDRELAFGDIKNGRMLLSEIGNIATTCWMEIPLHFPNVLLDEFVIMPDHMHGIVILGNRKKEGENVRRGHTVGTRHAVSQRESQRFREFGRPEVGSLSTIIGSFKSAVSKRAHVEGYSTFAWQSRFYEHIIRDGDDYARIRNYILENVMRWSEEKD
jgi:putative transposase